MAKKDKHGTVVVWPDGDLCRRVVLDGVEVTLERRSGVWCVSGEERLASEARLLDVLGQPNEALGRARGVVAALNADLVRPDQVSGLARRLASGWGRGWRGYGRVGVDERDALAVACAHLDVVEGVWEFVCWVLAKRLEWSLRRVAWVPPGRHAWLGATCWEFDTALDRRLGAAFFAAMAAHPDQRFGDLVVATDPGADPGRLADLVRCGDENLRDLLAVNPSTPLGTLEALSCGTAHDYAEVCVRLRVLQNPSTPPDLIAQAAVARTTTPLWQHWWRRTTADALQRSWAIVHPRCPSSLLRDLTSHSDPAVRATVAGSRRAPARVLEALAPSLDADVRAAVAANPNTPQALLERAAADPHRSVRAGAAANPNTPQALLERLAADPVVSVRRATAANPAAAPAVLRSLCDDADIGVAVVAARNPSAERDSMAPVVARFAHDSRWWVRAVAAELPDTPAELLGRLAADTDREVRRTVATITRTPPEALERIAARARSENDHDMLLTLLGNRSVEGDLRTRVAEKYIELAGPPPQQFMTPADRRRWATR